MQYQQAEKVTVVIPKTAAGTTNINGTAVDMSGWESVEFIGVVDTLTATQVTKLKAQYSTDNSTFADLEGTALTAFADNANNKAGRLEIVKPRHRERGHQLRDRDPARRAQRADHAGRQRRLERVARLAGRRHAVGKLLAVSY